MDSPTGAVSELVAFALFDVDPRVQQLQAPLHVFLVSLALFETGEVENCKALHSAVCAQLPTDASVTLEEVSDAVDASINLGLLVRRDDGHLILSTQRATQLREAEERIAAQRRAFHTEMRRSVELRYGSALSDEVVAALEANLEHQLQALFQEQSGTLAAAYGEDGEGLDSAISGLNKRTVQTIVNALVPTREKLARSQYAAGLEEGFSALSADGRAYLATLYQRTVAFALLRQDPTIRQVKLVLASRRVAFLDTNVLMAWMFEAHPRHLEAAAVIELARAVGCDLRVSRFTLEELGVQVQEAADAYERLGGKTPALAIVSDDILRTFHRRCRTKQSLQWTAFIADYLPPEAWLREQGIKLEDPHWAAAIYDDRIGQVETAIRWAKGSVASDHIVRSDARNLVHVQLERRRVPGDEMGSRVWFVTMDTSLGRAEAQLLREGVVRVPSSREARTWCDLLSPCVPPQNGSLASYVAHLVQSRFGLLAEDPIFVDKGFLVTLRRSHIDISGLIDGSPERARQVLVRLQDNKEVQRLLSTADEQQDEDWRKELDDAVRTALREIDESPERLAQLQELAGERDRALAEAAEARRERALALRELQETREARSQLEDRNQLLEEERDREARRWWRRVRRRLFGPTN